MIRVYYYSGFVEIDGERMLKEPPLARWYEHNGWSDPAPEHTRIAAVYSTNGGSYEVCHVNGVKTAADDMSPPLKEGWTYLPVGPGTQISVWEPLPAGQAKPAKKTSPSTVAVSGTHTTTAIAAAAGPTFTHTVTRGDK